MSASQAEHGGSIPLTCSIEKAPEPLKSKVPRGFFCFLNPRVKIRFRCFGVELVVVNVVATNSYLTHVYCSIAAATIAITSTRVGIARGR